MIDPAGQKDGTRLWVGLLTVTSAATTLVLACAAPFSSLAAIAATRMSARSGYALMGLTWVVSQIIGFGVLDYPRDPRTFAWGFAMLTAALAAMAAARQGNLMVADRGPILRPATAFGMGFIGYKLTLLAWSFVLGGMHVAASPYWTARQFGREALIFAALVSLYQGLVAAGVPAPRRVHIV